MSIVYYAQINENVLDQNNLDLLCKKRIEYVNSITDSKRRLQSYYSWKLLENVTSKYNGLQFEQNVSGKWIEKNNKIKFSISHSNNVVCVAVSELNIGVDVEQCNERILRIKRRFCFEPIENFNEIQNLTLVWTKEESGFKCNENGKFDYLSVFDNVGNEYLITACFLDENIEFIKIKL